LDELGAALPFLGFRFGDELFELLELLRPEFGGILKGLKGPVGPLERGYFHASSSVIR